MTKEDHHSGVGLRYPHRPQLGYFVRHSLYEAFAYLSGHYSLEKCKVIYKKNLKISCYIFPQGFGF